MVYPRVRWVDPEAEYQRGLADGRLGVDRAYGSDHYRRGYDDGLDVYHDEHCEEEGWDCA